MNPTATLVVLASLGAAIAALAASPHRRHPRPRAPAARRTSLTSAQASPLAAGILGGVALAVLLGGRAGVVVAVVGGWLISTAVRRLPSRAAQEREAAIVRWTPLLASLLAEMVHAGLPADVACARLSLSGDHPLAPQLAEVARRRALGADPATSVAPLLEQQATRRLGLALSRSLGDGASPVDALHALTADATAQRRAAAERECRRLASAAALPLGLTMLPAFMLVAVVPLVLAGIGPLLT